MGEIVHRAHRRSAILRQAMAHNWSRLEPKGGYSIFQAQTAAQLVTILLGISGTGLHAQ